MLTTTSLALAILLSLTQEEATRPEPPAPAAAEVPAPSEPVSNEAVPNAEEPTRVPESAPAPAPASTPRKRELSRITLRDGQVLHGMVVRRDARVVVVELATG